MFKSRPRSRGFAGTAPRFFAQERAPSIHSLANGSHEVAKSAIQPNTAKHVRELGEGKSESGNKGRDGHIAQSLPKDIDVGAIETTGREEFFMLSPATGKIEKPKSPLSENVLQRILL
jgi:hypothetical protein